MRLCRYRLFDEVHLGFYGERFIAPLTASARAYSNATHDDVFLPESNSLLDYLPPAGRGFESARKIAAWLDRGEFQLPEGTPIPSDRVELLVPIPRPNKLFLLAGNYADHIKEGGGVAAERAQTFPYVFMKPPTTTLTNPGASVALPSISPSAIDWELELAVVIGRRGKNIAEKDALSYVAGYTIINDISDRKFKPNPERKEREKDKFFDWLHGKWHDSFCPCGPCITSADAIPDPGKLAMKLTLNGQTRQEANSGQMIFPVAAIIEFISKMCTLEPGDIISTGTPSGVGNATGTYLKAGDALEATIEGIGTLASPVVAEGTSG